MTLKVSRSCTSSNIDHIIQRYLKILQTCKFSGASGKSFETMGEARRWLNMRNGGQALKVREREFLLLIHMAVI